MSVLGKIQIAGATDLGEETLNIEEWGGDVRVRGLTGKEWARCRQAAKAEEAGKLTGATYSATICACGIIADDGTNVFTERDAPELDKRSPGVLERVAEVILRLSGVLKKESDDIAKN